MIWESQPWKDGLLADADAVEILRLEDDASYVAFQKALFLTGFALRKLLEAKKLTDRVANVDVNCTKYPPLDTTRIPDLMNWHRLDEFYDFTKPHRTTAKLSFFSNQLIHSFIFSAVVTSEEDTRAAGFYVTTDFDRAKFLYQYDAAEITKVMRLVGRDHVVHSEWVRNAKRDWVVRNYGATDPEAALSGAFEAGLND
ncbi:hypothetical protein QC756_01330 [Sinorhizobium meliloti]|uniref:hypothetical protein n=1 Tax=Rhizobium meliloti TaxID=382 RepID=UPI00244E3A15|nr:hypothetical protein [Sinorhizobium meliloti]WGI74537.1 hypothetical protein QC756_01330 [Sinorhizobium meliloti]